MRAVPTVCYGSYLTDEMPSLFRLTWLICRFAGEPRNDGLVGVPSTQLAVRSASTRRASIMRWR